MIAPSCPATTRIIAVLVAMLGSLASVTASANLVDDINALRRKGCDTHAGTSVRLQASKDLDAVAREWSRGGRLRDALARTNYRAVNSASMHIEGARSERGVLQALAEHYCETLTDPAFTAIGIAQSPQNVHVVLALPFTAPTTHDAAAISEQVLSLVNAARAQPRNCGAKRFAAAPPLTLSALLHDAALMHAQDMAQHNFFEHAGSDGSTVGVRATRAGYRWRSIGENIASGSTTAQGVVGSWLDSPGHCANIMAPNFTQMGVAYATNPQSTAWIYWSQVFGST